MAIVKPFKAVRATRDKVALVSSKSYDAYSKEELEAQIKFNPFSFLHIISQNYTNSNLPISERFEAIKNKYSEFKNKHTYIKEDKPVYYVYQKITEYNNFTGIIAATSTDDYENNVIKKHEKTLKKREVLFKNYLKSTGFNAEPVLLTYPDDNTINTIIKKYKAKQAEYEFTTQNHKTHLMWIVDKKEDINAINMAFNKMDSLYIADGHHRSASSYLLAKDLAESNPNHTGNEDYNFCLSLLISEKKLVIKEFNRLVSHLNGLTENEFLAKLNKHFKITKLDKSIHKPTKTHSFSIYLGENLYLAEFQNKKGTFKTAVHELDAHILSKYILKKILGIKNLRKDKNVTYADNIKGHTYLKDQIQNGHYKVAFGLFPVSVEQMKNVANQGLQMPPKSTYIIPKLRSGLTIYEF